MAMTPAVFGIAGLNLTAEEKAFFRDSDPAGYIIFGRNIESKAQLRALTDELRAIHGRDDLAILIDQEGGRVARMQAPLWPKFPAGEVFDKLYDIAPATAIEAARLNAQAIAVTLNEVGITVDCHPLLDVRQPEEIATENVPGAVNIPLGALRNQLDKLPRDQEINVFCRSGQRSYYATRILLQNGFKVRNISGGMLSFAHNYLLDVKNEDGK